MRTNVAAATLNQLSNLLITAGLKPSLRMEILKRENLTLPGIKDLALKYENLQAEKPVKNGNSSTINATDYTNEDDEEEDVNAVRFQNSFRGNNNRGRSYNNRGNRGGANYYNPSANRGGQQTSQYRLGAILTEEEIQTEGIEEAILKHSNNQQQLTLKINKGKNKKKHANIAKSQATQLKTAGLYRPKTGPEELVKLSQHNSKMRMKLSKRTMNNLKSPPSSIQKTSE